MTKTNGNATHQVSILRAFMALDHRPMPSVHATWVPATAGPCVVFCCECGDLARWLRRVLDPISNATTSVHSYCGEHARIVATALSETIEILPLDDTRPIPPIHPPTDPDPRPILALADGTTVRADEMWENPPGREPCPGVAWANSGGAPYVRNEDRSWRLRVVPRPFDNDDFRAWEHVARVYPPPDDDRTAIIREELADQARRTMLRESIARLRPGDEVEITWTERAIVSADEAARMVERRCWARVVHVGDWAQGNWGAPRVGLRSPPHRTNGPLGVVGRTTFGLVVTAHEQWVTDVRPEPNEAVRASWVGRHA